MERKIIYVGKTGVPYYRETQHRTWLNAKGIENYRLVVVGPLKNTIAHVMEETEIHNRSHNKHLINKNGKKQYNEFCKKIPAKDYRQKAISIFRKGSKVKTVVGKFLD